MAMPADVETFEFYEDEEAEAQAQTAHEAYWFRQAEADYANAYYYDQA